MKTVSCMFHFDRLRSVNPGIRRLAFLSLLIIAAIPALAQRGIATALEELLQILASNPALQVTLLEELPEHLHGQLLAIAEFDDQGQKWLPMKGPQDFGIADASRISILGREAGDGGFVAARYKQFTDREVISYTGITADRRMSVSIYDDADDAEHLVLTIRIGPRQLKYLLRRPGKG